MKATAVEKTSMDNTQNEDVVSHHICDLKRLAESMQDYFPKEKSALNTIKIHLDNYPHSDPEIYTLEVWKYYRAYKLKEFLLNMRERIAVEKNTVDAMKNKTINMINDEFLWEMVKEAGGDRRKFAQKIYSRGVLDTKLKKWQ